MQTVFRKSVLDLPKRVGISDDSYNKLKELKKIIKKSMAQIVIDLIQKEYELQKKA